MAEEHSKKCPACLVSREMKTKTALIFYLKAFRIAKVKLMTSNTIKDVE